MKVVTTYINLKMHNRYIKVECKQSQVEELQNITFGSRIFIMLGDKNYNVNMIEYWNIDEIEGEDDDD